MPILKLSFFLGPKDQKQPWSYNTAVPPSNPGSVLVPLRKREYQTRQQQIRQGTVRRIGAPSRAPEDAPMPVPSISPVVGRTTLAPSARVIPRQKSSPLLASQPSSVHPLAMSITPPSDTATLCSSLPSSPQSSSMSYDGSSDTAMDWTATPSSPFDTASSSDDSSIHSVRHTSLSSSSSRSETSRSARGAGGSVSKSFMMMSQAMGFGASPSSTSTSNNPFTPTNSHLSVVQLGAGPRRMSTPSMPSSNTRQSPFDPSTIELPPLSSSSICGGRSSSLARPCSSPSVGHSSRVWVSSSASTPTCSSSLPASDDLDGYHNINQSHQGRRQGSVSSLSGSGSRRGSGNADLVSHKIPTIIHEREYSVKGYDKVFASTWLSDEEVLMGTKCNKLIVLNTRTNKRVSLGRLDECLYEKSEDLLPRLNSLVAEQDIKNSPVINRTLQFKEGVAPLPAITGIAGSLERGLRFFNAGRRSSTPSFPSPASASSSITILPSTNGHRGGSPFLRSNSTTLGQHQSSNTNNTMTNNNNNNNNHGTTTTTSSFGASQTMAAASTSAGIRSLSINPSRTLLAIGSGDPYQVTIYSIPEFEPVGMMHGHTDLVFSLTWVSNTVLVSGSRDGSMRVWSMESAALTTLPSISCPIQVRTPVITRAEERTKVRDLSLNKGTGQLMTLTTEGYVKLWDRESYIQISKLKLIHSTETVCMTSNPDANLFAVGSQSHISIVDPRTAGIVHVAESCDEGWGVRSLDFKSHIITTGGGYGRLGYYDLRAQRYLDGFENGESSRRYQEIGAGWLNRDTAYAGSITGITIRNAVYTMEYDSSGTRLFTAGGPLQLGLCGAYSGLWS